MGYLVNMWGADPFKKDNKGQTPAASSTHLPRSSMPMPVIERDTEPLKPKPALVRPKTTGSWQMRPKKTTPKAPRRPNKPPQWVMDKLDSLCGPGGGESGNESANHS